MRSDKCVEADRRHRMLQVPAAVADGRLKQAKLDLAGLAPSFFPLSGWGRAAFRQLDRRDVVAEGRRDRPGALAVGLQVDEIADGPEIMTRNIRRPPRVDRSCCRRKTARTRTPSSRSAGKLVPRAAVYDIRFPRKIARTRRRRRSMPIVKRAEGGSAHIKRWR